MNTDTLRIGNYVEHDGIYITVQSVFRKGINARTDKATGKITYIKAGDIKPIAITTDVLRKAGFTLGGVRWYLPRTYGPYVDRQVDKFFISDGALGDRLCSVHSFHVLQNIFKDVFGLNLRLRQYL